MSRKIYFVCSTPGATGNFIGRLVKNTIGDVDPTRVENVFLQPTPEFLTSDFFYDNIVVPDEGNVVINSGFLPNYEKLNERFPGCKIIVITHSLQDCTQLAKGLFKSFYIDDYEYAQIPYEKILSLHPALFKNPSLKPWELSQKEKAIFIKILAYHKLIDGFHSAEIPNDPNVLEVKFSDIHFNTAKLESDLESFIGNTISESDKALNRQLSRIFVENYLTFTKSVFEA